MGFLRSVSRFQREERGAAALLFAGASVPLMLILVATTDYVRASNYRAAMQTAVDSAAITLARSPTSLTDAQLQARGRQVFDAMVKQAGGYATATFTAARTGQSISVNATGVVQSSFGSFLKPEIGITAQAVVAAGKRKIELSLALDNTGSMGQSNKIVELKKAVVNLLDTMQKLNDAEPGSVKVALVPFTTQVKLGKSYANTAWVRFHDNGAAGTAAEKAAWNGCIMDRDQPQNVSDTDPTGSAWSRWHPIAYQGRSPRNVDWNGPCNSLQQVTPLTADLKSTGAGSLRAAVSAMQANGNTNVSIGVAWGLKPLMNRAPFSGAAAPGDNDVIKAMIVLTDGDNTEDRWSGSQSAIDARTRSTCDMAKDAVKNAAPSAAADSYVRLYTIRVIQGNRSLLQDCAGNGGGYSEVSQASQLNDVFQGIVNQILRVRLTS